MGVFLLSMVASSLLITVMTLRPRMAPVRVRAGRPARLSRTR
ncbi:MAG TPA: hypothetical protein PLU39_18440 [Armatimonadota bacterium]|mgnify:FL=1|nr:hypothetical protein [Armatimonadota bacterium]HPT99847.1 hypothetical protein [Armatimonadota bacterium]